MTIRGKKALNRSLRQSLNDRSYYCELLYIPTRSTNQNFHGSVNFGAQFAHLRRLSFPLFKIFEKGVGKTFAKVFPGISQLNCIEKISIYNPVEITHTNYSNPRQKGV